MSDRISRVYKVKAVEKDAIREAYKIFLENVASKEDMIKDWLGSAFLAPRYFIRRFE